ncbi:SAM-dependent methyltransferase [Streptomyces sulfonofaciens]|uniref:SAM-dependent methyltransferase n=1 Tax=Streptomyces sulfonofaciens TaxID=68272 RepID=UPI003570A8FA
MTDEADPGPGAGAHPAPDGAPGGAQDPARGPGGAVSGRRDAALPGRRDGSLPGRRDGAASGWREAAEAALYGPGGFYRRPEGPAGHFRTSVHASRLFAEAVARLLCRVDEALGHPAELAFVDMGAGRGELVSGVLAALPAEVAARARGYAVERAGAHPGAGAGNRDAPHAAGVGAVRGAAHPSFAEDAGAYRVTWCRTPPQGVRGLLFANEWLDNVPLDIVETGPDGVPHRVLVRGDGTEVLGGPVGEGPDARWLRRWWPLAARPGLRAEIGRTRDEAWAAAVGTLEAGYAVAADYGHRRDSRPPYGTLSGFRAGREVAPVPDGSCDITAHVALDACAAAGAGRAAEGAADHRSDHPGGHRPGRDGTPPGPRLVTQRAALHTLGLSGGRPPLSLATRDPAAYVRALAAAGEAAELTARDGLGGFGWLMQPVRMPHPPGLPEDALPAGSPPGGPPAGPLADAGDVVHGMGGTDEYRRRQH